MNPQRLESTRRHVKERVALFKDRAPAQSSSLVLAGTGVNGGLQYVVLEAIGAEQLDQLAHIDLISGSVYSYLCHRAIKAGQLAWSMRDLPGWDRANRSWHGAGLAKIGRYALNRGRRPLFGNEDLAKVLANTVSPEFGKRRVRDLPANVTIWLYDLDRRELTPVEADGPFASALLVDVVRCSSAVPALYGHGRLEGRRFIDPVYSPAHSKLLSHARARTKNVLVSNMLTDRVTDQTIWLKPHGFGDGRRMILADFARFALNLPNPRIEAAFRAAFVLE